MNLLLEFFNKSHNLIHTMQYPMNGIDTTTTVQDIREVIHSNLKTTFKDHYTLGGNIIVVGQILQL
jgi:hypothetical protein